MIIFKENGVLSLGRLLLTMLFVIFCAFWLKSLINGTTVIIPDSMIMVFTTLITYVMGSKIKDGIYSYNIKKTKKDVVEYD